MFDINFRKAPRSAYLHIPFCYKRCFYCDFAIIPIGKNQKKSNAHENLTIESYLEHLEEEIKISPKSNPLSTIYIGGGTPSILSPYQINKLLSLLRDHFGIQEGAEMTIEIDPASFDINDLKEYINAGINRVSLGGQSFDNTVLETLGRTHNHKDLIEACEWINEFYKQGLLLSWNLDLIQGIPKRTLFCWEKELKQAISISAPHLSIYELSVEEGTVFEAKQRKGELKLPPEEIALEMYRLTGKMLSEAGFSRYEISNYALPGHASRHNRVYWSGAAWWGFGLGATSAPWGERVSKPRTMNKYFDWVKSQKYEELKYYLKSKIKPNLDDQILVGLRRREGIDLESLTKDWGWNKKERELYINALMIKWKDFLSAGLLKKYSSGRICLTNPKGMELSNQILIEMLLWWDDLPPDAVFESSL